MADKSAIEWTDATWNPIVGCSLVSPGCTNCYAMAQADRIVRMAAGAGRRSHYEPTVRRVSDKPVWTGKVAMAPEDVVSKPFRWQRPRRIFVNSMGDVFHPDVPDAWIDCIFSIMGRAPRHVFQVLTKRSERMRHYVNRMRPTPLSNVWLGVSAEDQRRADERIPDLLATPAAVRWVSAEPLLGPIDFTRIVFRRHSEIFELDSLGDEAWVSQPDDQALPLGERFHRGPALGAGIDWVVTGGESGPGARPMHPDWARSIRDQSAAAGVPFLFKQWGEWAPYDLGGRRPRAPEWMLLSANGDLDIPDHRAPDTDEGECAVIACGKARAGRRLDGRLHDAYPEMADG